MKKPLLPLLLVLAANLGAQSARPLPKDKDRITGTIQEVSIAANHQVTIAIESGVGRIPHTVTVELGKITYANSNKPEPPAEVKKGRTLSCTGGNHNGQFLASICSVN